MALVAYAGVSTEDQSTDSQLLPLRQAGCAILFEKHASGGDRARPVLAKAFASLKKGDTLVVARIDRLARSLFHLLEVVALGHAEAIGRLGQGVVVVAAVVALAE